VLGNAVEGSFNRISIDGCESTNDSVFLLASGRAPRPSDEELEAAIGSVCRSLAYQIARDAEGGHRLMRIEVAGTSDDSTAAALGRAVADSVLWRCAAHGGDPNWGRILSALGTVDREMDLGRITVSIGTEVVFDRGEPAASLSGAAEQMKGDEFTITCKVGSGSGRAEVLTADTSPEYVLLNAEGTS
jgi:glutamate N-acetyltransferase/amino-acid N-acetyltransferase